MLSVRLFCAAVALLGLVAPAAYSQTFAATIRAVVSRDDAYLPGAVQMVAPAQTVSVLLHPQGRYVLIVQNEAAPPPGAVLGKPTTGASTLLLYDARSNKTKTLWAARADSGREVAWYSVAWLPGTDCAVAVVMEQVGPSDDPRSEDYNSSLLFFNFEKSLSAKTLLTTTNNLTLKVSPTKPQFLLMDVNYGKPGVPETRQVRMGNARAALTAAAPLLSFTSWSNWSADGATIYGRGLVTDPPATPDAKPTERSQWYAWDGKTPSVIPLPALPSVAPLAKDTPPPPALPIATQTAAFAVPQRTKTEAAATLHPLYLEATDTPADAPNRSLMIAPDADKSYVLADKSAVLYKSGGALYAVPLVRLSQTAFGEAQKAAAKQFAIISAKQVGLAILGCIQDYNDAFPPQDSFKERIGPYVKNADVLSGFTYVYPGATQEGLKDVGATVIGYTSTPSGRAVLYADGHVKWEDQK